MSYLYTIISRIIVLITVIPIHECAHGWMASKMGDDTAKSQGRLTLNPLRHMDPLGSLLLIISGFGWAKSVPVNAYRFRNRKLGMAVVALAGPVANILMALVVLFLYKVIGYVSIIAGISSAVFMQAVLAVLQGIVLVNVSLAVFNLLPIPPLDGSRLITLILPERIYFKIMQYESIVFIALFVLLFSGILSTPLNYLSQMLIRGLDFLTGFVDAVFLYGMLT